MTYYECLEEMESRGYTAMYRFPLFYGQRRCVSISDEKYLLDEYGPDDQDAYIYENKIIIYFNRVEKYLITLPVAYYPTIVSYEEQPYSMLAAECRK